MKDAATIDDYGTLSAPETLTIQRLLPGPIERVWSWLTQSDLRAKWLASGDMPMTAGAPFSLTWRNNELTDPPGTRPEGMSGEHTAACRVIEADPPNRLRYDWTGVGEVTFELQSVGEKVLLTLTHSGIPDRGTLLGVSAGWHAHLDLMAARLEGTAPKPHWDNYTALRADYVKRLAL